MIEEHTANNLHKNVGIAVESSYRKLEPFRVAATNLIKEYVGPGYGNSLTGELEDDRPVNLINQTVDAYTMLLAANRPRVTISTRYPELRGFAKHFEVAVNNLIIEIGLEHTIRQWVLDAFFSVGVIKVHMADSGLVELEPDRWMDPGSPYASNVALDDFAFDMGAKKWSEVRWSADMYRIPFADFQRGIEDGVYGKAALSVKPTSKYKATDEKRQEDISKGAETDLDELEPMVDLADVWVARDNAVYTYAVEDRTSFTLRGQPLAEMPWDGPEHGPYHLLGFNQVPNNIMPVPPALHLDCLSRNINSMYRRLLEQAGRQKDVNLFTAGAEQDAKNLRAAGDGEWRQVNDITQVGVHKLGGPDPSNQAFLAAIQDTFDRMAGNLPAMLGLGPQADTVGQEELIHGANSRKEGHLQYQVTEGTTRVIRALAADLWKDQIKEIAGEYAVPGTDYVVKSTWKPGDREGDLLDYSFSIVPHSMSFQSPSKKAEAVNQLIGSVYAPLTQQLASQGGAIDMAKLTDLYADALDIPKLREIISFSNPQAYEDQGNPGGGGKPPISKREYVRRSVSTGGTQQGKSQARQMALLGAANDQQQGMAA